MKTIILLTIILLCAANCKQINSAKSPDHNNSKTESNVTVSNPDSIQQTEEVLFLNKLPKPANTALTEEIDDNIEADKLPTYTMQLLMNTEYYEEEVENKLGLHKGWLGLYRKNNRYFLMPTTITIKAVSHNLRDEKDSNEKTGRKVISSVKLPNVFLLKNAPMLSAGEITTVFYGNETDSENIDRKYRRTFKFNKKIYTLSVEDPNEETGDFLTAKSKMIVSIGRKKQVIYEAEYCSDCSWDLCWVGDLDRDGNLDFMLNLNNHYNSTCHTLFLSSQAKKGEIVRDTAEMCQMGC